MDTLTIYKQDGTRQCLDIAPRLLEEDAKVITGLKIRIVGKGRHVELPVVVPAQCGLPTAGANVFDIDATGLTRTQLLELAANGFTAWHFDAEPAEAAARGKATARARGDEDPFPLAHLAVVASLLGGGHPNPDHIRDLVGYLIRVYKTGDLLTMDFRRDRVNFETDPKTHRIVRFWFG
jgi:hypothetical protein